VERNRRLTAEALSFALDEDIRYGLRAEGASPLEQDSPYAVFLTMTSRKEKLWPESRWIETGRALDMLVVLPWGNSAERGRAEREKRRRPVAGSRSPRSAQALRVRALYTALLRLALPLILLRLWWRGRREPGYRAGVPERLGHYELDAPPKLLWVHAVSVGEARAAAPLVRALAQALPDHHVLVTCTTAAGRETLKQVYGETVLAAYLPYDFPGSVRSFLEHFRPRLGVLMETEIWPNLLAGCARNGVPVLLANALLSEKSARGYALWSALTRPAFAALAAVCAQSAADAARLRALGAREVEVTGNLN